MKVFYFETPHLSLRRGGITRQTQVIMLLWRQNVQDNAERFAWFLLPSGGRISYCTIRKKCSLAGHNQRVIFKCKNRHRTFRRKPLFSLHNRLTESPVLLPRTTSQHNEEEEWDTHHSAHSGLVINLKLSVLLQSRNQRPLQIHRSLQELLLGARLGEHLHIEANKQSAHNNTN